MKQREIKFRAWDGESGKMSKPFKIDSLKFGYIKDIDNCIMDRDLVLMQYTNLKDKNGKEIWEGDILGWTGKLKKGFTRRAYYYPVVFHNGHFGYWLGLSFQYDIHELATRYEVIGNIYENKELLK